MKELKHTLINIEGKTYKFTTKLTGSNIQHDKICKFCQFYKRGERCQKTGKIVYKETGNKFDCDDLRPSKADDGLSFMDVEFYFFVEEYVPPKTKPNNQSQEERDMIEIILG